MTRFFFFMFVAATVIMSCGPEDQADIDRDLILDYIQTNNLQAEEDASGLFYTIDAPGGAEKPELTDSVTISYRGTLISGLQFDATDDGETATFLLDDLITGWKIGIPKYGRDGSGLLLVPSALGYGSRRIGPIPPNSVLVFEIELFDF